MRSTSCAAVIMTALSLAACGGEQAPVKAPVRAPSPPPSAMASASAPAAPPPAPPKPSLAQLVSQTLRGIGEAFNVHDAKKFASFYTADCTVLGEGEPDAHGRAEVEKALQGLFDTFSDARSAATRIWTKGSVAVVELAWRGTMTGDFVGMTATKKPAGQMRAHVLWFDDDGLIKEEHEYADSAGLMAQLSGKPGAAAVPTLPTNPADEHVATGTADEDRLVDWVKTVDETFNKDNPKDALGILSEDGEQWLNFTGNGAIRGKKEAAKGLARWFRAFPDQKWTATNVWGIDGFAIAEQSMSGTQRGRLGGLAPSNKSVTWHWLEILQPAADATIAHAWYYANLMEVMHETGALRPGRKPRERGKKNLGGTTMKGTVKGGDKNGAGGKAAVKAVSP